MQITSDLRLALPLSYDTAGEPVVYGYHTPISREVFDANFRVLSATYAALFGKGLEFALSTGPSIAGLMLVDEGRKMAAERLDVDKDGKPRDSGALALIGEVKRLTLALVPGAQGYEMLPIDEAIRRESIDPEDWKEAESALVFFTCAYWMANRRERVARAAFLAGPMQGQITSSTPMEFAASLRTSMSPPVTNKAASSVPS